MNYSQKVFFPSSNVYSSIFLCFPFDVPSLAFAFSLLPQFLSPYIGLREVLFRSKSKSVKMKKKSWLLRPFLVKNRLMLESLIQVVSVPNNLLSQFVLLNIKCMKCSVTDCGRSKCKGECRLFYVRNKEGKWERLNIKFQHALILEDNSVPKKMNRVFNLFGFCLGRKIKRGSKRS